MPSSEQTDKEPTPLSVSLADCITLHDSLSNKFKQQGFKKPFSEQLVGDDLQRSTGKWMKKERLIDREKDRYREIVTDPETGDVIRQCEEPLSDHRDRGSAKRPIKQP